MKSKVLVYTIAINALFGIYFYLFGIFSHFKTTRNSTQTTI